MGNSGYKLTFVLFFIISSFTSANSQSKTDSLDQKIIDATQREYVNLEVLLQGVGLFSFEDTDFNGGRSFDLGVARLGVNGKLDNNFDYRIQLGFTNNPVLLDAYIGYTVNDFLHIRAGSQKPLTSADQIPSPGDTDFIDRSRLVGTVYKRREIGVAFLGDIGKFHYNAGIYNGSGVSTNNDNNFFLRSRIAYNHTMENSRSLVVAVNSAYSQTENETLGNNTSIILDGERYSIGGDIDFDAGVWFAKAEFLYTEFEALLLAVRPDVTSSYATLGYRPVSGSEYLLRWERIDFDASDNIPDNSRFIFGLNRQLTQLMSYQVNLIYQFNDDLIDNQFGAAFNLQFQL